MLEKFISTEMMGTILMTVGMTLMCMDDLPHLINAIGMSLWLLGLMVFGDARWAR